GISFTGKQPQDPPHLLNIPAQCLPIITGPFPAPCLPIVPAPCLPIVPAPCLPIVPAPCLPIVPAPCLPIVPAPFLLTSLLKVATNKTFAFIF
uniref:Uncharacterized protein n=1 Tax=Xenopus tropicalis TaxID=8364 RepID=A0A6I8SX39_XENTR